MKRKQLKQRARRKLYEKKRNMARSHPSSSEEIEVPVYKSAGMRYGEALKEMVGTKKRIIKHKRTDIAYGSTH